MSTDLNALIKLLKRGELPKINDVKSICSKAKEVLMKEPNVLVISSPITICGDIHGQFNDLLELFEIGGNCPTTNYIFLGDYVDRGFNSIETFLFLLALKVKYPDRMSILRGNHESRQITQTYGFYDECMRKYNTSDIWNYCTELFDCLSLAALIDNKIFCVHGGLSPCLSKIDELNKISRFQEVPIVGTMTDLLWSDPDNDIKSFGPNSRGAGFLFGKDVVINFNHVNNIELIARAHQLVIEGYKYYFNKKLVTVWSAPNYCYRCGNFASILELNEHLTQIFKLFEAAPDEMKSINNKKVTPDYFL